MITLEQYFMGRDAKYASECTPEIRRNALELVGKVNVLLGMAYADCVVPAIDATTRSYVASGWRPPAVNDGTRNAASGSKHLTGRAVDLRDDAQRSLARWCLRNLDAIEDAGLWMEDPQWTPTWVHLQLVLPGSGHRVYIPSTAPALVAKLAEQGGTA